MRYKYILAACLLALVTNPLHAVEQDDYAIVLKNYVDSHGMVNYKNLKAQPQKLESFIASMDKLDPNSYSKFDDKQKIAFWLNAYNAFTLKAIIDNYPIKSDFFKSMYYPKNSIRQIPGVWDKLTFKVMSKDYTLEHIEHNILRKNFKEPGVHMAMVCAAMGCPPLRNEPYYGKKLDEQLDDQSRKFLANPTKLRFDPKKKLLHLSPIFKWFADDFTNTTTKKDAAILEFISKYLDEDHAFHDSPKKTIKIKYLDYDWSLNEQR
jgi:hypothetical protein